MEGELFLKNITRGLCRQYIFKMASPGRPKSPKSPGFIRKEDKEESFWEKIGTLGRKKRIKEGIGKIFEFENVKTVLLCYQGDAPYLEVECSKQ